MYLSPLIYSAWMATFAVTVIATSIGFVVGYRGIGTLIQWRRVKLLSTFAGLVAVLFLLLNYETVARAAYANEANVAHEAGYAILTLEALFDSCYTDIPASVSSKKCAEVRQFFLERKEYSEDKKIQPVEKSHYAPELSEVIDKVNVWSAAKREDKEPRWSPSAEVRASLFLWAAILVGLALGGSIGEAAFQYRQALDAERRANAASSAVASSAG